MHVLVTCKNEDDSIKKGWARVVTFSHCKYMEIFPAAEGQLTPQSLVRSGPISSSFEMSWMFLLPVKMKIRSKMKALKCSQHYASIFQGQITPRSVMVSGRNVNSSKL